MAIILRTLQDITERPDAARNDGDLVYRVGVGQGAGYQGMAGLVISDTLFLVGVHDAALALQADRAAFDGLIELGLADHVLVIPGCHQSGLIHQVRQVRAYRPRR